MYTFYEQTLFMIQFILLGMFISIASDTIVVLFSSNRWYEILIKILLWTGLVYLSCVYVMHISDGYLPFYFFLFFLVGYILYTKFLRKEYLKSWTKIKGYKGKIWEILFPVTIFSFFKKQFKKIKQKHKTKKAKRKEQRKQRKILKKERKKHEKNQNTHSIHILSILF